MRPPGHRTNPLPEPHCLAAHAGAPGHRLRRAVDRDLFAVVASWHGAVGAFAFDPLCEGASRSLAATCTFNRSDASRSRYRAPPAAPRTAPASYGPGSLQAAGPPHRTRPGDKVVRQERAPRQGLYAHQRDAAAQNPGHRTQVRVRHGPGASGAGQRSTPDRPCALGSCRWSHRRRSPAGRRAAHPRDQPASLFRPQSGSSIDGLLLVGWWEPSLSWGPCCQWVVLRL